MEKVKEMVVAFGEKHKDNPKLKFISEHSEELVVEVLSEMGFVNSIYIVRTPDDKHAVVLKHGQEKATAEVLSDIEVIIPMERQLLEYNCLRKIHEVCPGGVPEPYAFDPQHRIIAMEYLQDMELLGTSLAQGDYSLNVAQQIGTVLGCFHHRTHRHLVDEETWRQFETTLKSEKIREVYMGYRFGLLQDYKGGNDALIKPCDEELFFEIMAECKRDDLFSPVKRVYREEHCLVHVDLHSIAILTSESRIAEFDFELGGLGHPGLSLGFLLVFYYMTAFDKRNKKTLNERISQARQAMVAIVDAFLLEFGDDVGVLDIERDLIPSTVAVFGHNLLVWPILVFFPHFVQVEDQATLVFFMKKALELMKKHTEFTSLDQFINNIFHDDFLCQ